MAILGLNTNGGGNIANAAGRKVATKHTLGTAGVLEELWAWVDGGGPEPYIIHIHADSGGLPGARLAYTSVLTRTGVGVIGQAGFSVPLAAGTYWLGLSSQNGSGAALTHPTGYETRGFLSGATFNPPSDPFGSPSFGPNSNGWDVWAVVGAGVTPSTFVPQIIVMA